MRLAMFAALFLLTPTAIAAEESEMPDWMTGGWEMWGGESWADGSKTKGFVFNAVAK